MEELRALSLAYAHAADRRDEAGFVAAFTPDGVVEVHRPERPGAPSATFRGHAELATIPRSLARWSSTAHLVGAATYERSDGGGDDGGDADEATGEVACVAHHVRPTADGPTDDVLTIRYRDRYRRDDGRWRIARREVWVESVRREPAAGGAT